jgi:hypothetical protein
MLLVFSTGSVHAQPHAYASHELTIDQQATDVLNAAEAVITPLGDGLSPPPEPAVHCGVPILCLEITAEIPSAAPRPNYLALAGPALSGAVRDLELRPPSRM